MAGSERKFVRPATVDCIVIKNGKILLIKRKKPPFAGRWALPGGFVDQNETVERAALRELKEETGLVGKIQQLLGVFSDPSRDPRKTITVAMIIKITGGKMKRSNETSDVHWFKLNKLPLLAFDHEKIVKAAEAAK